MDLIELLRAPSVVGRIPPFRLPTANDQMARLTSQVLGCTEFEMRGVYAVSSGFSPHDFAAVTDGAHLFMRIEDLLPRLLAIGQGRLSLLPQICNATFEKQVRDVSGHVPAHQRANSYRDIVVKELHSNVNPSFLMTSFLSS